MTWTPSIPATPKITLKSPASVVAAVPNILGFRPQRSVVVLFLGASGRQVVLTVRIDLPDPDTDMTEWVEAVAGAGRFSQATHAIIVMVDDVTAAHAPDLPHVELVAAVERDLESRGLQLLDAVLVGTDSWWSYLCENPTCCPPSGTSLEGAESWRVQAEFAVTGSAPFASRDDVANRVAFVDDEFAHEVAERLASGLLADNDLDDEEVLDLLTFSVDDDAALRTDPDTAAQALVALRDVKIRDFVIVGLVGRIDELGSRSVNASLDALCALTRSAPGEWAAPVASIVGVIAWQSGDGALATCALERALAARPDYSLAHLVDAMVRNGVPPQAVRAGLARLDVDAWPA